jgi:chromosome segregation ATPase
MRKDELLEGVSDDKAKDFKNRLDEFETAIEDEIQGGQDYEKAKQLIRRMESVIDQVDENITSLQDDIDDKQNQIERVKKHFDPKDDNVSGIAEIEKVPIDRYHYSIKEVKEPYKQMQKINKRIREWQAYQKEILRLKARVSDIVMTDLHGEQISKKTYETVMEFNEKRNEEFQETINQRLEDVKEIAENRIDSKVTRKISDHRERLTRVEEREEFLEEKIEDTSRLLSDLLSVLDTFPDNENEQVESVKDQVGDLKQEIENPREHTEERIKERLAEQKQEIESESSEKPESDEDSTSDEPKYRFQTPDGKPKSLSELKEEFEKVAENEDPENHSFNYIEKRADVSNATIKNKIDSVRDEYDEEIIPNLGKSRKSAN